ncbi:MAG: ABC transporter permease [Nitrospira sp.]|nr:MAG: ABC transporter permease [Nitrospira sp.]
MKQAGGWLWRVSLANLFFLYGPIALLILFSFNASRLSATWQGWTWQWYRALWVNQSLLDATANSLRVATVSTVLALFLGVGLAVGLDSLSGRRQRQIEQSLLLPLVIPEVMMGVSLLLFFVLLQIPLSLITVMMGHALFNVPVVVIIVRARLKKLDPRLMEAAADLGATYWNTLRHVTIPLLRPAILGAGLMAFTISLDDFIVTYFTAGPGATTLPLKVYSMIKSGMSPEINALSALFVIVSMGLIGLSLLLQRR